MTSRNAIKPLVLLTTVVSANALAQGQSVDIAGLKMTPALTITATRDDNIFAQATAEKSSWIIRTEPSVRFQGEKGPLYIDGTYRITDSRFLSSSDDNTTEQSFSGGLGLRAGFGRSGFKVNGSYRLGYDRRGEGSAEGPIALSRTEPDKYGTMIIDATYDFNETGRFGFRLLGGYEDTEYKNNRIETQFRDHEKTLIGGDVSIRIAPKTRGYVEHVVTDVEYETLPLLGPTLDCEETRTHVGVRWEITGRTEGSASIGKTKKEFDDPARGEQDQTSWQVGLTYALRTYSVISLNSSASPQETNGFGSAVDATNYSVGWNHQWNSQLSTNVNVSTTDSDYIDDARTDDAVNYSFGANYSFARWLTFGASYGYQDRDSNDPLLNYDRSTISLSMHATL